MTMSVERYRVTQKKQKTLPYATYRIFARLIPIFRSSKIYFDLSKISKEFCSIEIFFYFSALLNQKLTDFSVVCVKL